LALFVETFHFAAIAILVKNNQQGQSSIVSGFVFPLPDKSGSGREFLPILPIISVIRSYISPGLSAQLAGRRDRSYTGHP
jgi:hypothetical protein